MTKGYITDHADRSWATRPTSPAWRDAFCRAFKAHHPQPKVAISSAHPRVPAMFQRCYQGVLT